MPIQKKIQDAKDIQKLRELYVSKRMSTTEIAKQSEIEFGFQVSASSVYTSLKKYGIPIRSISEGVSRAKSILDIDTSFINELTIEWIDGFLLGDGGINFNRKRFPAGARFHYCGMEEIIRRLCLAVKRT